ncbi:hypothetical protein L9G74_03210 [Shewanella sp. C32]|uniref:NACHT domain-containing protein n=1 Tax=Shewanella electrica TaxID=515560 RepID=A0ABT2FHJ9_9GAMM|nr:hypothetical protein [Shewanella electrica]MCH1923340.1 hypothetical protein [Shewanella electrica]MCS4555437.1 hypothetical protein [Shewanella electrica]
MNDAPVPLERRFSLAPKSNSDEENYFSLLDNDSAGWPELEQEFRCVILAEAGAGKTYEMQNRSQSIFESGRFAFFIRIEDIEDGFESSFEVGSFEAFQEWQNSQDEAWFFLDSVDEARLENPKKFEKAIKCFSRSIKNYSQRARVFISSRPYSWRPKSDLKLVEQYLPFKKQQAECLSDQALEVENSSNRKDEAESAVKVFVLEPLKEADIRLYAQVRNATEVDKLIVDLHRANLMSLAARPFDLDAVLAKWHSDKALDGRLELLKHNIEIRLSEQHPDRKLLQPLSNEKVRYGARLLAAAVILTGKPGIRIPDAMNESEGIDAAAVLSDWSPIEINALLERGIFNDVLYGMVRFRHRDIRELLAAEWFFEFLSKNNVHHRIETLFIREQYGARLLTPRLRSVLSWLLLFDKNIRQKALAIAPEVAVDGGDAAHLPLNERQRLLNDIVTRIVVNEDDRSARDNSAIARIAQPDLTADVLQLINQHYDNDDAIFFLGRLVWQGEMAECVPVLMHIAETPNRGIYARIAATRAVFTCGTVEQQFQVLQRLNEVSSQLPRQLLAEILEDVIANSASVAALLKLIHKLEKYEQYEADGLIRAFHHFIVRLPIGDSTDEQMPLMDLHKGLCLLLTEPPFCHQQYSRISETHALFLEHAIHVIERLIKVRSQSTLTPACLSLLVHSPNANSFRDNYFDERKSNLSELVPTWKELNDALFWCCVEDARAYHSGGYRITSIGQVSWSGHFWAFDGGRFDDVVGFIASRDFIDDQLVALSLAYQLYIDNDKPTDWLSHLRAAVVGYAELEQYLKNSLNPVKTEQEIEWEEENKKWKRVQDLKQKQEEVSRAKWIKYLKSDPSVLINPIGTQSDEIINTHVRLLNEILSSDIRMSRSEGADWQALIPDFGEDVANAYRQSAIASWRNFSPKLSSESGYSNSIPYGLIFGMVGLEIESTENSQFPTNLSSAEVIHALRYIVHEFNGFPRWFEKLYGAFPDECLHAVMIELCWELENCEAEKSLHYILSNLVFDAPWIHQRIAQPLFTWMLEHEVSNNESLEYCVALLQSGGISAEQLSHLARLKVRANRICGQLPIWFALWVDVDAQSGIAAMTLWLSSLAKSESSHAAQSFIVSLMGERRSSYSAMRYGDFHQVQYLKELYMLMHNYVRTADDIERAGKGVYSPVLRDNAQAARNALFTLLTQIPGKETYIALTELAKEHPDESYRHWMLRRAYQLAEQDGDIECWTEQQLNEFEKRQETTPSSNRQLFELTVDRLIDLKNWLERGNDSPYLTWKKVESETEMRNLISGWLSRESAGFYSCAQENELPNSQRTDILIQSPQVTAPVPIELKLLDKAWSGEKLCERLRNQLVGDYLRERNAGCGVFLLVWCGHANEKKWRMNGEDIPLGNLADELKAYWQSISNDYPEIDALEVMVIDLTIRGLVSTD